MKQLKLGLTTLLFLCVAVIVLGVWGYAICTLPVPASLPPRAILGVLRGVPLYPFVLLGLVVCFGQYYARLLSQPNYTLLHRVFGADWFKYKALAKTQEPSLLLRNVPIVVMCLCASYFLLFWIMGWGHSRSDAAILLFLLFYVGLMLSAAFAVALAVGGERKWVYVLMVVYALVLTPLGRQTNKQSNLAWMLAMAVERPKLDELAQQAEQGKLPQVPLQFVFLHIDGAELDYDGTLILTEYSSGRRLVHISGSHYVVRRHVGYIGNGWWITYNRLF